MNPQNNNHTTTTSTNTKVKLNRTPIIPYLKSFVLDYYKVPYSSRYWRSRDSYELANQFYSYLLDRDIDRSKMLNILLNSFSKIEQINRYEKFLSLLNDAYFNLADWDNFEENTGGVGQACRIKYVDEQGRDNSINYTYCRLELLAHLRESRNPVEKKYLMYDGSNLLCDKYEHDRTNVVSRFNDGFKRLLTLVIDQIKEDEADWGWRESNTNTNK